MVVVTDRNSGMKTRQIEALRGTLLERRDQIQTELDQMGEELRDLGVDQGIERGGVGNHLADDGSNVTEAERITTVSNDVQDVLTQINGALERMDDGTYGICERCGQPINPERLEAFPYVAYCIECQSFLERQNALRAGR